MAKPRPRPRLGADLLARWIGKRTQTAAAAELGVTSQALCRWLRAGLAGGRCPDLESALKLERLAGIAISSWTVAGASRAHAKG